MLELIMFDLDGTLLPMNEDKFMELYFNGLAKALKKRGLPFHELDKLIWSGTKAMIANNGPKTNENCFWERFALHEPGGRKIYEPVFLDYYQNDFDEVQGATTLNPSFRDMLQNLLVKGYRLILATNPIFPRVATEKRVFWAGLTPDMFERITTFENSFNAKPNLEYYRDLLVDAGVDAKRCLMIGNDVAEDMIAAKLGCEVFLLTDCLKNSLDKDINVFRHGNSDDLQSFLAQLPEL